MDLKFKKEDILVSSSSHPESFRPRRRSRTPHPSGCLGRAVTDRCTIIRNVYNPNVFWCARVQCKEEKSDLRMSQINRSCSGPFSDALCHFFFQWFLVHVRNYAKDILSYKIGSYSNHIELFTASEILRALMWFCRKDNVEITLILFHFPLFSLDHCYLI